MTKITIWIVGALITYSAAANAQNDPKMDQFIDQLMAKMTVEEKIGQLNLVTGGEATTGTTVSTDVEAKIEMVRLVVYSV
ncbi:hypothetical protein [Sphingobacterium sp. E70]|uniref:hypothetical protein n=1 Tax=Sphingobacterium sp. E70 TaxID=2853439 RepID=UPI0027956E00|nr:hypothetical protein [Sphingobacterium sp. E70]